MSLFLGVCLTDIIYANPFLKYDFNLTLVIYFLNFQFVTLKMHFAYLELLVKETDSTDWISIRMMKIILTIRERTA